MLHPFYTSTHSQTRASQTTMAARKFRTKEGIAGQHLRSTMCDPCHPGVLSILSDIFPTYFLTFYLTYRCKYIIYGIYSAILYPMWHIYIIFCHSMWHIILPFYLAFRWHSIRQSIWHSIWQALWHSIWNYTWLSIWHIVWNILKCSAIRSGIWHPTVSDILSELSGVQSRNKYLAIIVFGPSPPHPRELELIIPSGSKALPSSSCLACPLLLGCQSGPAGSLGSGQVTLLYGTPLGGLGSSQK